MDQSATTPISGAGSAAHDYAPHPVDDYAPHPVDDCAPHPVDDCAPHPVDDCAPHPADAGLATVPRYRSLRQQGIIALIHTADAVRRYHGALLEPYDITVQQYNVLRILRGARPEALPTMEIAERMIEQAPGITRLLDRLDAKGLVSRVRCASDRRQVLCSITERGLALLAELDAPVDAADARVLEALEDAEVSSLVSLLDRIHASLGGE